MAIFNPFFERKKIDSHLKPAVQAKNEMGDWYSLKVTGCPKEMKKLGK